MLAKIVLFAALAAGLAGSAAAAGPPGQDDAAIVKRLTAYAPEFSKLQVASLRQSGWAWGEIVRMLVLAQLSGKPFWDIAALRSAGASWEEVARQCAVEPGLVDWRVRAVAKAVLDGGQPL